MASYDVGDIAVLTAQFTNEDDAPVNPTTVEIVIRDPAGESTTYVFDTDGEVTNPATGFYKAEIPATLVGTYGYRWRSTGPGQAAEPSQFRVRAEFPPICQPTVDDVAALVRARTRDKAGALVNSFTDDTQPTRDQVQALIENETGAVLIRTGELDSLTCTNTSSVLAATRQVIAKRVAALVEASYRPEEISQGRTVEDFYQGQMEADLDALVTAARECRYGESPDTEGFGSLTLMSPTAAAYVDRIGGLDPFLPPV